MKVLFFLLFASTAFCDWRLSFFCGDVKIEREGESLSAKLNMPILTGDIIRTGENSLCEIRKKGDIIKIEERTEFVVKDVNREWFEIVLGKVFARIERLKGRDFTIYTPTTTMGLRGTVFSVEVADGVTRVAVFRGEIEVLVKEARFIVKRGSVLRIEKERIERERLSPEEKSRFKKEFPGIERKERRELRSEIREIRRELVEERKVVLEQKRRDFSAGRTMRDRWGNITRVEQHLYRPDNYTIRFVNLNKRDSTEYVRAFNYFLAEAEMNKELPDDISKWPDWIAGQIEREETDIRPHRVKVLLSNGRPNTDCDEISYESFWDYDKDEMGDPIFKINNGTYDEDTEEDEEYDWEGDDWYQSDEHLEGAGVQKIYYDEDHQNFAGSLKIYGCVIDNNGNILKEEWFSKKDIWYCAENTGFELRIENYKKSLLKHPIDIIFTLDIAIAVIKEFMGDVVGEIGEIE
jgi:hypothetical protein